MKRKEKNPKTYSQPDLGGWKGQRRKELLLSNSIYGLGLSWREELASLMGRGKVLAPLGEKGRAGQLNGMNYPLF